jgi:hypothetical protein
MKIPKLVSATPEERSPLDPVQLVELVPHPIIIAMLTLGKHCNISIANTLLVSPETCCLTGFFNPVSNSSK